MRSDLLCTLGYKSCPNMCETKQDNDKLKNILLLTGSFLFSSHTGQFYFIDNRQLIRNTHSYTPFLVEVMFI